MNMQRKEMAMQQEEIKCQMKTNNDMMKVLKVTMNSQALINNAQNARSLSSNPFEGLEMHSNDEEENVDNNTADDMDEAVDDD